MCVQKVCHRNRLGFRNVQRLCEDMREVIGEYRLPRSLLVNGYNDLFLKWLTNLFGILSKQLTLPVQSVKVRQVELILDIERRDRAIVTELCNTLDSNDANAVRAPILIGEINTAE